MRRSWWIAAVVLVVAEACSSGSSGSVTSGGRLRVVAAENFWGDIAAELGGDHVDVSSIVSSPDADPHDYEATPRDGRSVASARYVIVNGLGYDAWVTQAVDANPSSNRTVLDIGELLGLDEGANPHRWYFPEDVRRVIAQITDDYKRLDNANAAEYDRLRDTFETSTLRRYNELLAAIEHDHGGTAVAASESIVEGITEATGLDLITPPGFIAAVSEGREPSPEDKATVDRQIAERQVGVLVYNEQNTTPDVQRLLDAASANGIEVVPVTETPPAGARFHDWQADQLQRLADALARSS